VFFLFLSVASNLECKQAGDSNGSPRPRATIGQVSSRPTESIKTMEKITIVPGASIGPVNLGASQQALPSGAHLEGELGRLGPIRFVLAGGTVKDIWVEDLETGAVTIELNGHRFSKVDNIASLQGIVGTCKELEDMIGGTFYNCAVGVAIGVDVEGRLSQIRVKPR